MEKYRHNRTVAVDRIGAEGGEEDEGVSSVVVVAGAVATAGEDRTGVVLGEVDVSPGEDAVVSACTSVVEVVRLMSVEKKILFLGNTSTVLNWISHT